jgi:hypothetical protein
VVGVRSMYRSELADNAWAAPDSVCPMCSTERSEQVHMIVRKRRGVVLVVYFCDLCPFAWLEGFIHPEMQPGGGS